MASGINVGIAADTREFEKATRTGLVDPIDDAQKALDDYVRAGDAAGTDMSRSFERQQRSTEDLRGELDRLSADLKGGFRGSTRSAAADVGEFSHKSREGFEEIKDSARQNAIEVGASFTGGMDQAIGGLQGFLAEFLAGFGPGGVIAGVGIAALLGVVSSALDAGTQSAEAQQQAVTDLATSYIDAGSSGKRSFDDVKGAIESMATSKPGEVILTLQQAWEDSRAAGADYSQVVQAIATTSPRQINAARAAVAKLGDEHVKLSQRGVKSGSDQYAGAIKGVEGARKLDAALGQAADQARDAARAQELAAKAGLSKFALKAGEIHQLEQGFDDAAGAIGSYLNKEKDTLKVGPYLDAMKKREKALEELHGAYGRANLDPAAVKFLESQGADAAAAALRGYQQASPKQQAALNHIWSTAGSDNATNYKDALGKDLTSSKIDGPKIQKSVVPLADTSLIDAQLRQPKYMKVIVDVFDRKGQRVYP